MNDDEKDRITDLLQQARDGDTEALGELLQECRPYLYLLSRAQIGRRLRVRVDTDDLIQETLLQVTRTFSQFQGSTVETFLSWLRMVLASRLDKLLRFHLATEARSLLREQDLWTALDQSSHQLAALVPVSPNRSPSSEMVNQEQLIRVTQAMQRLPEDYREALVLRHLEGLSWAEVAQRLNRPSDDAARHVWARAIGQLRAMLGAEHE